MTPEQRFLSEGAAYFGHRFIYRNQDVGVLTSAGLVLTAEGEKVLANLESITDVTPKVERKKVKIVPRPTEPLTPVLGAALDDMMADIK